MHAYPDQGQSPTRIFRVLATTLSPMIMATFLAGCAVGPKFVKPEVALNQRWSTGDSTLFQTRPALDSAWWSVFADSTLDRLVGIAYRGNLPLQEAGLRIIQARAQLGVAVGRLFPQTQVAFGSALAVGINGDISKALGIDRNFWDFLMALNANWEMDIWGKYRNGIKAQTANFLSSIADYDDALVMLTAEVARTYTIIRTFQVLVELTQRNAQLQEEGLRIAESRFRNGATSELDVTQATTLLASTRASIPQIEASMIQAQNALCTLLGQPTGTIGQLITGPRDIPSVVRQVSVLLPAEMLRRRPDVRKAELMARAQAAQVGVAKSFQYPSFQLFGLIGTSTASGTGVSTSSLFTPKSFFYLAGPQLLWPVLNYGRIKNAVRSQDALLQQLLIDYKNTVLNAAREVEDGLTGYVKARESVVYTQNAAEQAQRAVELTLKQYREGAVDYQRVLDAQRSQLEEETALARARSAVDTSLISVYKALGGGWELRSGQMFVTDSTRIEMERRTKWGNVLSTTKAPANSDTSLAKESWRP
jgi:NodT family efflux transporter outer membrane factor (OMF) lipoprotein